MVTHRIGCTRTLCIVMQGALWLALPAHAQDRWGGSVAVTTDYVYRGISQTRGEPALQGGLQLQSPDGWTAGVWGSTVKFSEQVGPRYEIDLHLAQTWRVNPDWFAQLAFVHYAYPDSDDAHYDYDELTASLSFQQRVTASVAWSPNTSRYSHGSFIRDRRAVSYELTVLQPVAPNWSVYAGTGYYDLRELIGSGYWFWNVGLAFKWDALQVDLMHIDSDSSAGRLFDYPAGGAHWTAALSWRF